MTARAHEQVVDAEVLEGGEIRLSFAAPDRLMSMNDRSHWRQRASQVRAWRQTAFLAACSVGAPSSRRRGASVVSVSLPVRDGRRRDPHNYYPTVKAIVDGCVDAEVWPDDTPEWVTTIEPRLVVDATRAARVVVTIGRRPGSPQPTDEVSS